MPAARRARILAAMLQSQVSRDELEAVVREYKHLREEHRRAGSTGRVRRHMEARLRRLESRFERLLDGWSATEELRAAWRAHLHGDAPEPAEPTAPRPLVFRGRAETGSVVEIRERADGDYAVEVDGRQVERIAGGLDFSGKTAAGTFTLAGVAYRETFSVSRPALEALAAFAAGGEPRPSGPSARELLAEGLIDRHWALTPRGRRALGRAGR
jgi:hypothetical protein